jgi:CubicO group peptidase (beta-lactamase class C family)
MEKIDFSDLEKIIRKFLRDTKTPGLAMTIIKDNEQIYSKGFGSRDLQSFLPMNPDTLLGIGSITKSFTAFAILILEERGLLSIEDPVNKYLKFKPFISRPEIKIVHLLSHSSGLPAADASVNIFNYIFGNFIHVLPTTSKDDFIAHLGETDDYIIFKPGEKIFYNNDMYTCLSFIIEQISGVSYKDFLTSELLKPLKMNRAVLTKEDFLNDPLNNIMSGYRVIKEGSETVIKKFDVPIGGFVQAGGGLYVSMNEMMNYAKCLLNKGSFDGKQLLNPESIKKLWSPQVVYGGGFGSDMYCLGWVESKNYLNNTIIHHSGGMDTSCSYLGLIPEKNIAIAFTTNSCTAPNQLIAQLTFATLLGFDLSDTIKGYKKRLLFKELCGKYISPAEMYSFEITLTGGYLNVKLEIDDGFLSFPVLLKNIDTLEFIVCDNLRDKELIITFIRNKNTQKVEFVNYDRYLFKKV